MEWAVISSAFSFYTKPEINNVSLSAIAARAGITKPAIYRHFKSRQELEQVLEDRVYSEIYSVLSKITFKKDEGTLALIEDVVVLLLTHKEYLFFFIISETETNILFTGFNNFMLDWQFSSRVARRETVKLLMFWPSPHLRNFSILEANSSTSE